MRPGLVIEVLDSGNIKAEAPGLFSRQDKENIPPIMPFFGLHANTYSEPKLEDEVWILSVTDNPRQLFWFRKDDRTEHNQELESEQNVEVLCNREAGLGYATIYFSDGTGWMFRNGDSFINIEADGSILLDPGISNRKIHLCQDSISLGKEGGSTYHGVRSEPLQDFLEALVATLDAAAKAGIGAAPTMPMATALQTGIELMRSMISPIKSRNVTLN